MKRQIVRAEKERGCRFVHLRRKFNYLLAGAHRVASVNRCPLTDNKEITKKLKGLKRTFIDDNHPHDNDGKPITNLATLKKRLREQAVSCECGGRTFTTPSNLRVHWFETAGIRFKCNACGAMLSAPNNLKRHARSKHGRVRKRTMRKKPEDLDMEDSEFAFLKKMVRTNIFHDKRKRPIVSPNSAQIHDLTVQLAHAYLKMGPKDQLGGRLPEEGLVLRPHAGIFQCSLDRISDKDEEGQYAVHFPNLQNALANIQMVPLGVNVCFKTTVRNVRRRVRQDRNNKRDRLTQRLTAILNYEAKKTNKRKRTTLWLATQNHFRTRASRSVSETRERIWTWAKEELRQTQGRCAVSGILMDTNEKGSKNPFQMSIDAIDPCKGHEDTSNLRLICACFNCTNCKKTKKCDRDGDRDVSWTRALFKQYYGVSPL